MIKRFIQFGILIFAFAASQTTSAVQYAAGDLAPRGNPDGQLNAGDLVVLTRMANGLITPTATELLVGDVGPLNAPDTVLDARDVLILQRAIMGQVTLGTVTVSLPAPTLNAVSSPTIQNPYQITGTAQPGATVNIYVNGSQQQQVISDAGDGTFSINVYLFDGTNVIHATETDGVDESPPSNIEQVVYNNTISRTQGGLITANTVWTPGATLQQYTLTSPLTIAPGASLILMPGAQVDLGNQPFIVNGNLIILEGSIVKGDNGSKIEVNGILTTTGTSENPVAFISSRASPGWRNWQGIHVISGGSVNLDHCEIAYGDYGVRFYPGSSGSITNCDIHDNITGIHARGDGTDPAKNPIFNVNNSKLYTNSSRNINTGTYANNTSVFLDARNNFWGTEDPTGILAKIVSYKQPGSTKPVVNVGNFIKLDGSLGPQLLFGLLQGASPSFSGNGILVDNLTITPGQTLTLLSNSTLILLNKTLFVDGELIMDQGNRIESSGYSYINVTGILTINGIASNPVVLEASGIGAGRWNGIQVSPGGIVNINYAIFKDALYGVYLDNASGSIKNSIFTQNVWAIYLVGASNPLIDSNAITENFGGIRLIGTVIDPLPTITNNDIYSNTYYNQNLGLLDIESVLTINNNWWGTNDIATIRLMIKTNGTDQIVSVPLSNIAMSSNTIPTQKSMNLSSLYMSPLSSSGTMDDVTFSASLTSAANWTVEVRNSVNQLINSYTGSGAAINVVWDGKNLSAQSAPEGLYQFDIRIGNVVVGRSRQIRLDNTLPQAIFDSALMNAVLNGINSPFLIVGTVLDQYFSNYIIDVADGTTPIESDFRPLRTSDQKIINDTLWVWPFGSPGSTQLEISGVKTLRLRAFDLAGNSSQQQVQVTINTLVIDTVSHDVITINPVKGEVVTISFNLSNSTAVTLKVSEEKTGTVISNEVQNFASSGSYSMAWDGKDDNGNYVQDEAYVYTLEANDGVRQASYAPVYIYTQGSISSSRSAIDFNVMKNEFFKIPLNLHSKHSRLRFCVHPNASGLVNCGTSGAITLIDKPYEAKTQLNFVWNGRDLADNAMSSANYRFYFPVPKVLPVNSFIVKGSIPSITGEDVAPNIEVKSNPYIVRHSYEEFTQIKFQVDQNSTVMAKLLPPGINNSNDSSAIVLMNNLPIIANTIQTMDWKGYLDSDTNNILVSTEGMYTFTIEATSNVTGLKTLYRGAVSLYH